MLKKSTAATILFLLTLAVSTGCPREEPPPARSTQPASTASSSGTTSSGTTALDKPADAPHADKLTTPKPDTLPSEPAKTSDAKPQVAPPAADEKKPPSAGGTGGAEPSAGAPNPDDPLFKGWPKPLAVIVATGMQMGYIEPCGCSGKENQKGGLSRRHSLLKKLAADGWTVVPLDVGGQVRRFGNQAEIKFQRTADALKTMHYRAIAFGDDDLRLPAPALTAAVADNTDAFVSANAALFGFDQKFTPRFQIIPAGKLKLGVTAIVGDSAQRGINNDDVKFKPAAEALKEVLPDLQKAHCDHLILLAHATKEETKELAKQFPEFEFIITSGGASEPPREPIIIDGTKTRLIEVGQKGMFANVIGFFDDPQQPVRFLMVPLEARLGESDEMHELMASYQDQLKQQGLTGLDIKPTLHPSGHEFVGSKVCGDCHTKAFAVWSKTPHAKALDTLANLKPSRQYDPECLSCHVTGWEPQKFYPFTGGFMSLEKTPLLAHNGCENCHGPGSAHVAAESGDAKGGDKQRDELRASMRVAKAEDSCIQCHDADNSLKFDFKTYWPKIEHHGKD